MRHFSIHPAVFAAFFLIFAAVIQAQDVKQLFDIEKKFCKSLTEIGLSNAFMKFMADDGIMFVPTPASGQEHYKKKPNNFKSLFWEAEFAEISSDGNFGYTTGPWYIPRVSDKGDTTYSHGHFNTVWQKINGEWKFLIDCGIDYSNEEMEKYKGINKPAIYSKPDATADMKNAQVSFNEITSLDNDFNISAGSNGIADAYNKFSSKNIRSYRDNIAPAIGFNSAKTFFTKDLFEMKYMGGRASNAGDFAFTYGTGIRKTDSKQFNYMRVWKKEGTDWKIVLDVLTETN